jgi:hypothetical protein
VTGPEQPRCRTCGRPIVGCAVTKHGGGWVHLRTNAERCPAPHRAFAQPPSLEDLNARHNANVARTRARRRAS